MLDLSVEGNLIIGEGWPQKRVEWGGEGWQQGRGREEGVEGTLYHVIEPTQVQHGIIISRGDAN